MKLIQTLLAGALLAFASIPAQAADSFIGTWTLNTAKSKFSGTAPKSMTRTYAAQGDAIAMTVKIVGADGKEATQSATYKQDGKDYPFKGSASWDTLVVEKTSDGNAKFTLKRGGKVVGGGTRTLSADGKTMTVASKVTNPDGSKSEDTLVLDRK